MRGPGPTDHVAMGSVVKRLDLLGEGTDKSPEPVGKEERVELLVLAGQLTQPDVSVEQRMEIAFQMCQVLGRTPSKT